MLPKTAEYALRAIVWLAREPERARFRRLSGGTHPSPAPLLAQSAARLSGGKNGSLATGARRRLLARAFAREDLDP